MATDDAYLAFDDVLQFVTTRPTGLHRTAAESVAKSDRSIAPRVARVAARWPRQNVRERSAVALGGLAGNNAHGAGFLEALRLSGKAPQIITCTSGQILWTATYLRGESLKDTFAKQLEGYRPFGELLDLNVLRNVANNDVQRIRLALAEFPEDFAALYAESWKRFWTNPFAFSFLRETLGLWPARSLVNQDGATFYEEMADQFNSENERTR